MNPAHCLLLGWLCLGLLSAQAESMYHRSPQFAPRDRYAAPVASPLLGKKALNKKASHQKISNKATAQASPAPAEDSRIHPGAPPPLSPAAVPVSLQPEPKNRRKADSKASKSAPQLSRETTPAGHPVVTNPDWDASETSRMMPVPGEVTPEQTAASPSPALEGMTAEKTETKAKRRSKAKTAHLKPEKRKTARQPQPMEAAQGQMVQGQTVQGKVEFSAKPEPVKPVSVATPVVSTAKSNEKAKKSGIKPLVHFPEELTASGRRVSARKKGREPGFYPVGYRPYVPALGPLKVQRQESALLHYNRASYYGHSGQLDDAIQEYRQAIRRNPELGDAYVGLSSAYMFRNNWEEVMLNAEKALSLKAGFIDPANITQARYNLSTAYCAANDYRKSKRLYKKVKAAHHPQSEDLQRYLEKNCKP